MEEKRRQRRDFRQNIAITLLTVSAVVLFFQTQLYHLGADTYLNFFSLSAAQMDQAGSRQTAGLTAPIRVAVSNPYGRYASVTMHTDDEEFSALGRVLREAISAAGQMQPCSAELFHTALSGTSVYCDFLNPLPMSILSGLTGAAGTEEEMTARALVAAVNGSRVDLYLWDGDASYFRGTTTMLPESLESTVNRFEMSSAYFAYERSDLEGVSPYTLFLENEPVLLSLKESVLNADVEDLLEALRFNPRTNYRYAESEGTEVVVEGGRTLRIHMDGSISYLSGGEDALSVEAADTSLAALAEGCDKLLASLTAAESQATMYLESVRQDGDTVTLVYGYELGGIPIRLFNGGSAATITLSGTTVSEMEVRLRQYTYTDKMSNLLPVRQAAAIAQQYGKTELFIGYIGGGVGTLDAQWLVE